MQMWPAGLAGIEIKVDGFSHKLPLLVTFIFQQLVNLKVEPDRYETLRSLGRPSICGTAPELMHMLHCNLQCTYHNCCF